MTIALYAASTRSAVVGVTMMRSVLAGAVVLALATACGGGESSTPAGRTDQTITVHGVVRVPIYPSRAAIANGAKNGETCIAKPPGFSDVAAQGQVVIRDETGTTLGVGSLDNGVTELVNDDVFSSFCRFAFSVSGVPSGRRFYAVSAGGAQRGEVQYTADQIREPITVSIGP